ncbi:hypothetical protein G6F65_022467 [Rhizopus arrhizus]|nr:hypothetical protein G6F65_022467 [Rhizopus arrhizus]
MLPPRRECLAQEYEPDPHLPAPTPPALNRPSRRACRGVVVGALCNARLRGAACQSGGNRNAAGGRPQAD